MLKFRNLKGHRDDQDRRKKGGPGEREEMVDFGESSPELGADAADSTELAERAEHLYQQVCDYSRETFGQVRRNMSFSLDEGSRVVNDIVNASVDDALFSKALHEENGSDFLVTHAANVAIYSIKMGASLGLSKEKQVELGMAGLLHDVGKCTISEEVLYKQDRLNDEELSMVREASNHGYDLLRSLGKEYAYLAECCLHVYERTDGSGYPKGLKGDEIHEYAQIIGLVDFYEALTHSRPQREKFLHFAAVKEIINSGKSAFQRQHLKALLRIFSIFPLDSYVKLNSNAIGRVTETYLDQPMRPRLQIISDSQGSPVLTEQVVNLPEHPLLYIVDSVAEATLREVASA